RGALLLHPRTAPGRDPLLPVHLLPHPALPGLGHPRSSRAQARPGLRRLRLAAPAPGQLSVRLRLARLRPATRTGCDRPDLRAAVLARENLLLRGLHPVGSPTVPDATNLTTAEGLATLNADLAALEGEGRREIAERIKTAREWGDLKENSEYHDAKNEQAHLETKIARLREKIADAVIVEEDTSGSAGVVGFGSTVVVRDPDGREQTWRIVSSHDA